jgi:CPA1 family monovalent cation:H+ antiporter
MEEFIATETLIIELVLVATLVAIVAGRIRLPYTVALVLVGLFIAIRRPFDIEVTPELILALFVPPLIFEAAFHLDFRLLRANLALILVLAVPGVVATTLLVGGIVAAGTALPLAAAVVFGALIAATDPVAVVALFRALGVPHRLAAALEGESLFNDGTAIVLFSIALEGAASGVFDPLTGLFDFLQVAIGGIMIGVGLGWLTAQLIARIDEPLIVTSLTTLLAYGAYVVAERLHVSGVLAVVMAGLVSGDLVTSRISPTTKIMLFNLWEYLAFLANSLIFLLIGLDVDLPHLSGNLVPIGVAVGAVLLSRAVVVYGLSWLVERIVGSRQFPHRWRHVLFWGGLRGAISLALALSLPVTLVERKTLQAMTFGVLLFTLLGQGTTIRYLLKRLGLIERPKYQTTHEMYLGRHLASHAGLRRLADLNQEGLLTDDMWAGLRDDYHETQQNLVSEMNQLFSEHPELERETLLQARREALQTERVALGDALRRGLLSDEVYEELRSDVDRRLEAVAIILAAAQESSRAAGEE